MQRGHRLQQRTVLYGFLTTVRERSLRLHRGPRDVSPRLFGGYLLLRRRHRLSGRGRLQFWCVCRPSDQLCRGTIQLSGRVHPRSTFRSRVWSGLPLRNLSRARRRQRSRRKLWSRWKLRERREPRNRRWHDLFFRLHLRVHLCCKRHRRWRHHQCQRRWRLPVGHAPQRLREQMRE